MSYFLKALKLDVETGSPKIALLNEKEAWHYGIHAGDHLKLTLNGKPLYVSANTSKQRVKPGRIGLYKDIWEKTRITNGDIVQVAFQESAHSIQAIKRRLLGKRLKYEEIYSIISDIATDQLSKVQITYFVASGFMHDYTNEELYFLTKAMAETGDMLHFPGLVADKHSVGGLAGNRTTMIVVPILAALGIKIPKTSSRAITSPAGTADTMEVLAPVTFTVDEIKKIVGKTNGCLVWGGGLSLAPADDKILQVSYPMSLEPYSKMIVSIMAKKVATGVNHLIIDMPVGPTTKIPDMETARMLEKKFQYVAAKFSIKLKVSMIKTSDPVGFGVGPALEARDVLRVLQQKKERPGDLSRKAVHLAGQLLELVDYCKPGAGATIAWKVLDSGRAWRKMREIIKAQGGDPNIDSEQITLGAYKKYYTAAKTGQIVFTDNKSLNLVCRTLGAPSVKLAGVYLNKEYGVSVRKGERLFTIYAENKERLNLASKALEKLRIFHIK
ncbi:MAG: AMP phosphorylase [Candidatus Komeilibacteria bacterium RIFCSPHIGHO2_01_FULL_52_14]|uniref:AMP phosphorylase n=1 Tax=Candidatus Komeilibacteria bacterium RIFCSPHIGHO2_01_FULL_52_14 TaxID=1798549 RepID=A0A1G2BKZ5_9BACT|nr:MAG: AMP phosphorylase [Candidatus Komeilibacteria bacterium RIFCSPHIGHO2_01_FULL_52_14]